MNIKKIQTRQQLFKIAIVFLTVLTIILLTITSFYNQKNNRESISHGIYFDYSDPKVYVGAYTNIFTGEVIGVSQSRHNKEGDSYTDFNVRVIDNIKGDLKNIVIVRQDGGKFPEGIEKMEDNSLIEKGKKYIFTTRSFGKILSDNGKVVYKQGSYPGSLVLISEKLKNIRENGRYKELLESYPEEIIDKGDIKNGLVRNAYKDLSEAKKRHIEEKIKDNK